MMVGNGLLKIIADGNNMLTVFKVLGLIWLGSAILLGLIYLWAKLTGSSFCENYDGDDF